MPYFQEKKQHLQYLKTWMEATEFQEWTTQHEIGETHLTLYHTEVGVQ